MRPFEGCRLRIERAKAHGQALADAWNAIPQEQLYKVVPQVNCDGTGTIRFVRVHPLSATFSLQLGEMLYQLRAALDGSIYQAAIFENGQEPPPNEQNLEFPICNTSTEYRKKSALMLRPLSQERRRFIESVQPYNAPNIAPDQLVSNPNRSLGILNDWARKDRHRRLHVIGSWVKGSDPKIAYPPGVHFAVMNVIATGFLRDDNVIAEFRLVGYKRGMEIMANPYLKTEIAVDEKPAPIALSDTLENRLKAILGTVIYIVSGLEDSF